MPKYLSSAGADSRALTSYFLAAASAAAATGIRLALDPAIGPHAPYLPFVVAVIITARWCGRLPALLCTALSALSADFFFLEPHYSWVIRDRAAFGNFCVFVVVGVSVSYLIGGLREAVHSSQRSEARFRTLFSSMDEGFATCRMIYDEAGKAMDFRYLEVNPAFSRLTGLPAEIVSGRTVRELIPGVEHEWIETYERIIRTGGSDRFSRAVSSLGKLFEVFAFRTGPGEFGTVFTEISEKRRVEEDLRFLAGIVHSSDDAVVGENLDGTVRSWNQGAELMFGHTAEEMIGKPVSLLVPEDCQQEMHDISRRIRAGSRVRHHETARIRKDGQRIDISLTASPVYDDEGRIKGISRISRDITERKKAEEQLYESGERFRALVTASSDVICRTSPDWTVMRYLKGSGLIADTDEPDANWLQKYVDRRDQETVLARIAEAIRTSGTLELEHRMPRLDGSVGWVLSRAVPVRDKNGQIVEWFGAANDITERKQAEHEVHELNTTLELRVEARTAELLDANRELEAFAYSVSHDLRAPLRAVDGFAKILLRDYPGKVLDETASDYMRRMSAASQRMNKLIADLLDLSRLSRQEMRRQNVDLTAMAESIFCDCRDGESGRQVLTDVEKGLTANADPQLMRVVLENLLGNAWKYTGKTPVAKIHFGAIPGSKAPEYYVRDNGVGFDMKHADQLYTPFQRLHRSDEFEGNGIGLAIVHRIIRRHGGRVWADAKPDLGATFYFTLGEDQCRETK